MLTTTFRDYCLLGAAAQEVLFRVHAIGVNPVETYIRSGAYGYTGPWPYTPGNDASGIVEEIGEGVSKFNIGDKVYSQQCKSGAYAELAIAAVSAETQTYKHAIHLATTFP